MPCFPLTLGHLSPQFMVSPPFVAFSLCPVQKTFESIIEDNSINSIPQLEDLLAFFFKKRSLFWMRMVCSPVTAMLDETVGSLCRSPAINGFSQYRPAEHQPLQRGQTAQMAVSKQQKQKPWWAASPGLSLRWGCDPPAKQRVLASLGQRLRNCWSNPVWLTLVNDSHQQVNIGVYSAVSEYSHNILWMCCTRFWLKQAKHA